ncbi:MAG: 7-cyano-7-deazaguanine synthase, partial [Patescibacteria group bacterium]|nr:7-cyano-7-deazaguanine synthase [Patescibacteria group bacterium]
LLSKSFLQPMEVIMPTVGWQKKALIALLKKSQVFQYTVSCWNAKLKKNKIIICGQCANCLERKSLEA